MVMLTSSSQDNAKDSHIPAPPLVTPPVQLWDRKGWRVGLPSAVLGLGGLMAGAIVGVADAASKESAGVPLALGIAAGVASAILPLFALPNMQTGKTHARHRYEKNNSVKLIPSPTHPQQYIQIPIMDANGYNAFQQAPIRQDGYPSYIISSQAPS